MTDTNNAAIYKMSLFWNTHQPKYHILKVIFVSKDLIVAFFERRKNNVILNTLGLKIAI